MQWEKLIMLHELKISPKYYDAVVNGIKTFEIRKNDRNYSVGDTLRLREFDKDDIYKVQWATHSEYTGKQCVAVITYIFNLKDFLNIDEDYVVLGIKVRE